MDKQTQAHLITIYELIEKLAKNLGGLGDGEVTAVLEMARNMAANLGEE